jgi:carotenoid biosynthesis protein
LTAPPTWAHELLLAPAVLALTFVHARRALGLGRALVEVGALAAYGYALEWIAMGVFRSHDYGRAWRLAPAGVPVAVAAVWASIIVAALTFAARRGMATAWRRAAAAALIAISLDLLMEPVAVRLGLWRWTPPGAWMGVPLGNFVGWAVIVATWCAGVEREPLDSPLARVAVRRVALAVSSIAALVLVGAAWRALRVEGAFAAAGGWALAGGAWLTTLLVTGRRRPGTGWSDTLAGRLGGTTGLAPEAAMVVLAAGFAADAWASEEPALRVAAASALAVVGSVSVASGRFALSDVWRARALSRFAGAQDLVRVLMKPPNGQPWTADDRRRLRGELRALARWTPGFVLFLLPGGLLVLVVYAHLLDRRRLKRPTDDTR